MRAWLLLQEAIARGVTEVEWCEGYEFTTADACCEDSRHDMQTGRAELYRCMLWIGGEPATSLGGILLQNLGHDAVASVLEAELAWECQEELQAALSTRRN